MAGLLEFSNQISQVVETLSPSVVRVDGGRQQSSTGVVWAGGVVIAANHALAYKDGNSVDFGDGVDRPAVALGHDPSTDLAVLRVDGALGTAAPFADSADSLKVGQLVLKLGRPGKTVRASLGIISALGPGSWRRQGGTAIERYLEADAAHQPGFSGGPLVSADGKVLGITTTGLLRGHSLTVPAATVRKVVEQIVSHGQVRRAYLGISSRAVRLPDALAKQLGGEIGLLIHAVEPGGPADRAGIQMGDTLVGLGKPEDHVEDLADLENFLADDHVDQVVPAKIVRGGQVLELNVTIGLRP
jgi:S1-C subfamily serine protease